MCSPGRWPRLLEGHPVHWKAVGLIASQGTYVGSELDPWLGHVPETTDKCFSPKSVTIFLGEDKKGVQKIQ